MSFSRMINAGLLLFILSGHALAAPASEKSVKALFNLSQVSCLFDTMSEQVNVSMDNAIRSCPSCEAASPEQRVILQQMKARIIALLRSEYSFSRYEPQLIAIYQATFTESEIQGMLRFYRSSAGRAFTRKMPLVTQQSMRIAQQMVADTAPQLQAILSETSRLLKASRVSGPALTPTPSPVASTPAAAGAP